MRYINFVTTVATTLSFALLAGCSSPTSPSLTPMQSFAAAHANEVCVLSTKVMDGIYIDYGVLVPIEIWAQYPSSLGIRVMPISFCNPAE